MMYLCVFNFVLLLLASIGDSPFLFLAEDCFCLRTVERFEILLSNRVYILMMIFHYECYFTLLFSCCQVISDCGALSVLQNN